MKITASDSGTYLGVFSYSPAVENAQTFADSAGINPSIVHVHVDWAPPNQSGTRELADFLTDNGHLGASVKVAAEEMAKTNRVLALSWDPLGIDTFLSGFFDGTLKPEISMQDILNGGFDSYIRSVAQQAASINAPLMMSLFGEINAMALFAYGDDGTSFKDTTEDQTGQYGDPTLLDGPERARDVYRKIIDIFKEEGADNVSWFIYMSTELATEADQVHPSQFYPGDDYIDFVGQSIYISDVSQLDASFTPGYNAWGEVTNKPIFIPELGMTNTGASQLDQLLTQLNTYDRVAAATFADFPNAESDWGVPRLGSRTGDWEAIQNSTGYLGQVEITTTSGSTSTYEAWRDATGLSATDNLVTGSTGADIILGSEGGDQMQGFAGSDIYVVDNIDDEIVETADGGNDTVLAFASHTLSNNVEALFMEGANNLNATGNGLNNTLSGNTGVNLIVGQGGDDTLDGVSGADTLDGGSGNDTFLISDASVVVVEAAGGGTDTVLTSVSMVVPDNVEFVAIDGVGAIDITGNNGADSVLGNADANQINGMEGDDTLRGNEGDDFIIGGAGFDLLEGGDGNDRLIGQGMADTMDGGGGDDVLILVDGADLAIGGEGADRFEFRNTGTFAQITDFEVGVDTLDVSHYGLGSVGALQANLIDLDTGTLILMADGSGLVIDNVLPDDLMSGNLVI